MGLAPSNSSLAASFYRDLRRGSGSPDPRQGWSVARVGDCPLSETFSLAFGFSMRKCLVRPGNAPRCASAQLQTFSPSKRQLLRFICLGSGVFNHAVSNLTTYSVSWCLVITLNHGRVSDLTNSHTCRPEPNPTRQGFEIF